MWRESGEDVDGRELGYRGWEERGGEVRELGGGDREDGSWDGATGGEGRETANELSRGRGEVESSD